MHCISAGLDILISGFVLYGDSRYQNVTLTMTSMTTELCFHFVFLTVVLTSPGHMHEKMSKDYSNLTLGVFNHVRKASGANCESKVI